MKINTYPDPWDLRYFQEIAYTQNISRASERLGVGQPALSLSLKRLEQNIGVTLFYRRNKGLTLTSAGQRLLKESNKLLSDWESVVSQTKKSDTELVGKFSIGCHPSVAIYTIGKVVKDIYSAYPELEIQMQHGLSRVVCERVISGEIDFGIVVNPIKHPDLVIHKLAVDQVAFWKLKGALSDVLICNPLLTQTQFLLKKINNKNIFVRTITSDSLEVISTLAKSGVGTAILPTRVVQVFTNDLIKVDSLPSYQDEITFMYRADIIKTNSSKCIIDAFKTMKI